MTNSNSRLEAFCDGVFAIAITLLVIDIKIPATVEITNTVEFWDTLGKIIPSIASFLLSFFVILVTWINHHNHMRLINRSSSLFLCANGFLLLTVAFIPFPTSLLGEYLFTDHAAPAVILYDFVLALQALSWILISRTAIKNGLGKSEKATLEIRRNGKFGIFAFFLYSFCTILAIWFPLIVASLTAFTWLFWLIYGITMKNEEII